MNKIENGKITDIFFGIEDHGCMTLMLTIEGKDWGCGFGGYQLLSKDGSGMFAIKKLLQTFNIQDLYSFKNKVIRVKWLNESYNCGNKIIAIGDIIEDKWFSWEEAFEEYTK